MNRSLVEIQNGLVQALLGSGEVQFLVDELECLCIDLIHLL